MRIDPISKGGRAGALLTLDERDVEFLRDIVGQWRLDRSHREVKTGTILMADALIRQLGDIAELNAEIDEAGDD